MIYLFTPNATKRQGGAQFTPVTRNSGQLYGTLAVERADADRILSAGGRWVQEISKEDFDLYEARRQDLIKNTTVFPMPDLTNQVLPKVTPVKVTASVSDILQAKPV